MIELKDKHEIAHRELGQIFMFCFKLSSVWLNLAYEFLNRVLICSFKLFGNYLKEGPIFSLDTMVETSYTKELTSSLN